jgi:threonine dehydrogenase-like Zn-dependent dehydrogenase
VAVDTTGAPCAIEAVFSSLDRGGRLLIFGVTRGDAAIAHGAAARLAVRPRSVPRCPGPGPRRRVASYQASQRLPHAKIILYSDARHAFLFQHADDFGDEVLDFLR